MAFSLVSVIIPCHNAAPWIADAIRSALAQTHSPIEVVVVDDGSTDESRDIIRSFGGQIKFEFLPHGGASRARNRGLQLAAGAFVQFLDADDILFPQCVKRKTETAVAEKADVVYSGGFFFNVQANLGNYEPQAPPGKSQADAIAHVIASTIVTTLLMCRRTSLEAVGAFDEQLVKGQEHDLLLRMALEGFKLAYVPEALSLNRTAHNLYSITAMTSPNPSHLEKLFDRFEEKLKKTTLWTGEVRAALACRFHHTGVGYLGVANYSDARRMFHRARGLDGRYSASLPLSRRLLVPITGGYLAERILIKLRQRLPRFLGKGCGNKELCPYT
jgi:glycosyltransferase involved in cell wall biosynthesis